MVYEVMGAPCYLFLYLSHSIAGERVSIAQYLESTGEHIQNHPLFLALYLPYGWTDVVLVYHVQHEKVTIYWDFEGCKKYDHVARRTPYTGIVSTPKSLPEQASITTA